MAKAWERKHSERKEYKLGIGSIQVDAVTASSESIT